jgi:hypothetical protein
MRKKYVPCRGLAFFEEKEMKKLSEYAKKGWILESFTTLGYKLRKGEPRDIVYSLDYQKGLNQEHIAFFEGSGWSHVCSVGNEIHFFSAPAGTKPIYTDISTTIDKYEREKKQMGKMALPFLISTVLFIVLSVLGAIGWIPKGIGDVSQLFGIISLVILIFPGLPYLSYRSKLNKLRKG